MEACSFEGIDHAVVGVGDGDAESQHLVGFQVLLLYHLQFVSLVGSLDLEESRVAEEHGGRSVGDGTGLEDHLVVGRSLEEEFFLADDFSIGLSLHQVIELIVHTYLELDVISKGRQRVFSLVSQRSLLLISAFVGTLIDLVIIEDGSPL
jgi:hypothetical protein